MAASQLSGIKHPIAYVFWSRLFSLFFIFIVFSANFHGKTTAPLFDVFTRLNSIGNLTQSLFSALAQLTCDQKHWDHVWKGLFFTKLKLKVKVKLKGFLARFVEQLSVRFLEIPETGKRIFCKCITLNS